MNPVRRFLSKRGEFSLNAFTLAAGTTFAQIIPVAISPILTRLYTPEDFGTLGIIASATGILAVAATGRYELAIMLPETEFDADTLVILSVFIAIGFGLLSFLAVAMFRIEFAEALGAPQVAPWLYYVPLGAMLTGVYNSFNYWLNRHKQYLVMSRNRVLQSAVAGGMNLSAGSMQMGAGGLVFAPIVGQLVTTIAASRHFFTMRGTNVFAPIALRRCCELAIAYRNHVSHLLPAHWVGVAAMQIPVFVVSSGFGLTMTGFFAFAYRLVSMPSQIVASALGDVYRQQAAQAYRETGEFRTLYLDTLKKALIIAVLPFAFLFIEAPDLFALIFGERWRMAGDYARIISISSFFQFICTPVDKGALIVGATRYILVWNFLRFLLLTGSGCLALWFGLSMDHFLYLFVAANATVYLTDAMCNYHFSLGSGRP